MFYPAHRVKIVQWLCTPHKSSPVGLIYRPVEAVSVPAGRALGRAGLDVSLLPTVIEMCFWCSWVLPPVSNPRGLDLNVQNYCLLPCVQGIGTSDQMSYPLHTGQNSAVSARITTQPIQAAVTRQACPRNMSSMVLLWKSALGMLSDLNATCTWIEIIAVRTRTFRLPHVYIYAEHIMLTRQATSSGTIRPAGASPCQLSHHLSGIISRFDRTDNSISLCS